MSELAELSSREIQLLSRQPTRSTRLKLHRESWMCRAAPFLSIASIVFYRRRLPRPTMATTLMEMPFALYAGSKLFGPFAATISPESRSSST
jgi:hypothetical protein